MHRVGGTKAVISVYITRPIQGGPIIRERENLISAADQTVHDSFRYIAYRLPFSLSLSLMRTFLIVAILSKLNDLSYYNFAHNKQLI